MRKFLTIVLAMAFVPLPAAEAQSDILTCAFDNSGGSCIASVDLFDQGDKTIRFSVTDGSFSVPPASVLLQLDCDCDEEIRLSMSKVSGVWRTDLDVSTRDLVKGAWTATPLGTTAGGTTEALTAKTFAATATDNTAPVLTIAAVDANDTVTLGAGQSLSASVQDSLLRRVTYQIDGMPKPFLLPFPYSLSVASFKTGYQNVTIVAEDRVGLSTSKEVIVYADAQRPEVSLTLPKAFYDGTDNIVKLRVKEHSNYTVRLTIDKETTLTQFEGNASRKDVQAKIAPNGTGARTLQIAVTDALGNNVAFVQPINVTRVETDTVLISAKITSSGAIRGEPVRVNLTAAQAVSVIPLTFDVAFKGNVVGEITLPKSGPVKRHVDVYLPAGVHKGRIGMVIPERILELNPGNEMRNITLEVFLARVIKDNTTVHIRADSRGLPQEAVDADGKTYPLTLKDDGLGARYTFQYKGEELYWNPVSNTTVIKDTEAPPPKDDDKGIPGPGIVLLLAGIAVALARRR